MTGDPPRILPPAVGVEFDNAIEGVGEPGRVAPVLREAVALRAIEVAASGTAAIARGSSSWISRSRVVEIWSGDLT